MVGSCATPPATAGAITTTRHNKIDMSLSLRQRLYPLKIRRDVADRTAQSAIVEMRHILRRDPPPVIQTQRGLDADVFSFQRPVPPHDLAVDRGVGPDYPDGSKTRENRACQALAHIRLTDLIGDPPASISDRLTSKVGVPAGDSHRTVTQRSRLNRR